MHQPLKEDADDFMSGRLVERRRSFAEELVFNIEIGWKAIICVVVLASYVILNLVGIIRGLFPPNSLPPALW